MKKIVLIMCEQCGALVGDRQRHGESHTIFGSFIKFDIPILVTKRKKKVDRN